MEPPMLDITSEGPTIDEEDEEKGREIRRTFEDVTFSQRFN